MYKKRKYLYCLLILTMCLYGSLYIANKYIVNTLDTSLILMLRYAIASVVLIPVTVVRSKRDPVHNYITKRDGIKICAIGILGYVGGVGSQLLGTKFAGAATASVINAMNPIAITLMAAVLLKERLVWYRTLAICLAVGGAVTIIGGVADTEMTGIWWSILAVVLWSLMSVLIRRYTRQYDPLAVTTLCMTSAAVVLFPIVIIIQHCVFPHITWKQLLALLYIALACTTFAHSLWNFCLSHLDASTCSMFYPIQPLVSTTLAAIILHEAVTSSLIIGGIMIILGLLLALWMERRSDKLQ